MQKYWTIFSLSWQNEFTYRINFILWRVRNILGFLMVYFLWSGIFLTQTQIFGYSQNQILTYIFIALLVRAMVMSAPSADNIGSEIGSGDLSNYLLKPVGYLKFWFTRDLSSKLLNLSFVVLELTVLYLIFKPDIQPPNILSFLAFLISAILATITYFFLSTTARFIAFWAPEDTWGLAFILFVLIESLGGGLFPLDILPDTFYTILQFTPFPYLLYFPIAIFAGKVQSFQILPVLLQSFVWVIGIYLLNIILWKKGLRTYTSAGR
ncbi:MAG: ABC-2 family transporter protein [Candidatus Daviesbacteria bacterium]|nr:ABC-2 family transporter protein [Candidatus Daviesbacteria bacterium]